MKREWYVAICDVSGEFEGNPESFEAARIFGPYTAAQAMKAEQVAERDGGFPHATYSVVIFKANSRPTFPALIGIINARKAEAVTDEMARKAETDEIRASLSRREDS